MIRRRPHPATLRECPARSSGYGHGTSGAVLLILLAGCAREAPVAAPAVRPKVTVVEVAGREIVDYDEFVGRTEASETVEVRSRVSGFIKEVHFADGDQVAQDAVLFTIEPDEYQAIHQQSLARIELWEAKKQLAESKVKRAKKLVDANAMSIEEYEESVSAEKEALAQISAAQADANHSALDVKYTEVRAQLAGRIDRAQVTPGNMVTGGLGNGTLLTRIVQNTPMHAYFDLDERTVLRYQRKVAEGRANSGEPRKHVAELNVPCYLQLADETGFPHVGKLDFIENRIDASTGTIRVRGVFANEEQLLTGGMFVRIRIPASEPYQAVLIPEQSIGTDQSVRFVYVIKADNTAERRTVTLGSQRGPLRVIRSGVAAGERVVYRGLPRVRPNQEVEAEMAPLPEDTSATSATPVQSGATPETGATPAAN